MSKNKTIIYLLLALFFVTLIILVYGVYEIRLENQKISDISNQADEATRESAVAGSIKSIKNSYAPSINKIESLVVTSDGLVPFIESIEKLGKDMGLTIKTTSVSLDKADPTKEIKYPSRVHISIETDGPWGGSLSFLAALESLPTKVFIDSTNLTLGVVPSDSTSPTLTKGKLVVPIMRSWHTSTSITVSIFK